MNAVTCGGSMNRYSTKYIRTSSASLTVGDEGADAVEGPTGSFGR